MFCATIRLENKAASAEKEENGMEKLKSIGAQLYTARSCFETVDEGKRTLEAIKKMGYDTVQVSGITTLSYEQLAPMIREAGLSVCGTHTDLEKAMENPSEAMRLHDLLGTKVMGTGGFHPAEMTAKSFRDFIDKANAFAAVIAKEGFRFTYHNHSHEFLREDGVLFMDLLADGLDPKTTGFVLDTYWIAHGGGDVRYWIEKLAGRIPILHLKDMIRLWKEGEPPQAYTEVGRGNLYWEGIIESGIKAGVENFVVELDVCPGHPLDSLKISADYLRANFM